MEGGRGIEVECHQRQHRHGGGPRAAEGRLGCRSVQARLAIPTPYRCEEGSSGARPHWRSIEDSWEAIGLSPSPSTMSLTSSDTVDHDTPNNSDGFTDGGLSDIDNSDGFTDGGLSDIDTIEAHSEDETEDDRNAFTIYSTPGGVPPRGSFSTEIIEVMVGAEDMAVTYKVHVGVLTFYSKYFKIQLEGGVQSGRGRRAALKLKLPFASARTIEVFVHWMYTRDVPEGNSRDTSSSTGKLCTRVLCELWVFGNIYVIPQLQNDMVTKIVERVMHSVWKDSNMHAEYVYTHADKTELKELVMDLITFSLSVKKRTVYKYSWMQEHEEGLSETTVVKTHKLTDLAKWDLRPYHV
ncbi:uncharacterized protein RCC_10846 [Ramularia collo-cygni]|uniref:BTB domain-containing protein n=1 Tax=Ramularia collo-cygni TaxID=112498 RepID=A0A2D3V496_9PEZI|nr:uncharacterized protein RCC_10846 [Ramularia collo-cygni]CZT25117.1 uncharacterized protein RCC_10846 [Ramularia collo-cygni]